MSTVDNRVVNMQFNNKNFESNVANTMSSLQKLEQSLQFKDGRDGLKNVENEVNNVDFSRMESGIESLKNRFSTLGIVGMTAIQNLTNGVMGFIRTLGSKALSGGINRSLNLQKADFMLQGIVDNEKEVKKIMDDVNDSVDGTAYSLDQAALVAAQFAATGMRSGKEMQTILKGVTGISSVFSADYQRVGEIFTQVSAQNRVYANDLNSLSTMGVNAKAAFVKYFTEVEKKSNVTTETIDEMVKKGEIDFKTFGNAMAYSFGDQAKEANRTFTGSMSNVNAALARLGEGFVTPFVQTKKVGDEFYNLIDVLNTFRSVVNRITNTLKDIGLIDKKLEDGTVVAGKFTKVVQKASMIVTKFLDVLAGETTDDNGTKSIFFKMTMLQEALGMTDKDFGNLTDTVNGILSIFKIFGNLISSFLKAIFPMKDAVSDTGSGLLAITGAIGRYITGIEEAINESKLFEKIFSGIGAVVKIVGGAFSYLADKIGGLFSGGSGKGSGIFSSFISFLDSIGGKLKPVGSLITTVFGKIKTAVDSLFDLLGEALSGANFDYIFSTLNLLISGGIGFSVVKMLDNMTSSFSGFLNTISNAAEHSLDPIDRLYSTLNNSLTELSKNVKANTLVQIAKAIAILSASVFVLSLIKPERLASGLFALQSVLGDVMGIFFALTQMQSKIKGSFQLTQMATAILIISGSMLVLAAAVKLLSTIPMEGLAKGIVGVGFLLLELGLFVTSTSGLKGGAVKKAAKAVLTMSVALYIISAAVKKLGSLNAEQLAKGLVGVGIVLAEMAAFIFLTKGLKVSAKSALGILAVSAALIIISKAVKQLGNLNAEQLSKGLTGLGFVLLELAAFIKLTSGAKGILLASVGMFVLAQAMGQLTNVLTVLGGLNEEQLAKGLLGLGGSLLIIAGAMRLMPANMVVVSAGLFIAAEAIKNIAGAMSSMGGMSEEEMAKSLVEMAGALGILAIAMQTMNGALAGAAAMLIVSAALSILAPVLATLGSMSLEQIGKSLLALAGAFIVLGVAGAVLGPLAPMILLISAAIGILGIGLLAAGTGMMVFISACELLGKNIGLLVAAIPVFIDGIVSCSSQIAMAGVKLILALLSGIASKIGNIVAAAADIVISFINGVAEKLPDIIDAGMNLAISFINGIAQGIEENGSALRAAIAHLMGSIVIFLIEGIQDILSNFGSLGKGMAKELEGVKKDVHNLFGDGKISKTAEKETGKVKKSAEKNYKGAAKAAENNINKIPKSSKNSVKMSEKEFNKLPKAMQEQLKHVFDIKGIDKDAGKNAENLGKSYNEGLKKADSKKAGKKLGEDAVSGGKTKSLITSMTSGGGSLGSGYVLGISNKWDDAYDAGYTLGAKAKKGEKDATKHSSPSKVFIKAGKYVGEGYVIGIKSFIDKVYNAGHALGDASIDSVADAMSSASSVVTSNITEPVIRPVLDLSSVKMGANQISSMFNSRYALGVTGGMGSINAGRAVSISNDITVNGAENPSEWADEFARELEIQARTF